MDGIFYKLHHIAAVEFLHDVGAVVYNSLRTDAEFLGYITDFPSFGQKAQDLLLQ